MTGYTEMTMDRLDKNDPFFDKFRDHYNDFSARIYQLQKDKVECLVLQEIDHNSRKRTIKGICTIEKKFNMFTDKYYPQYNIAKKNILIQLFDMKDVDQYESVYENFITRELFLDQHCGGVAIIVPKYNYDITLALYDLDFDCIGKTGIEKDYLYWKNR